MDMALSRMAEKIITRQYSEGNQFYRLLYGHIAIRLDPSLIGNDNEQARVQLLERAKELVGNEGPYSVDRTANQIITFVQEQAQGDQMKAERYRAAVQEAFHKMAQMSGGHMPDLTQETYEAVMVGLTQPSQGTGTGSGTSTESTYQAPAISTGN
jgi:hypothetical protein